MGWAIQALTFPTGKTYTRPSDTLTSQVRCMAVRLRTILITDDFFVCLIQSQLFLQVDHLHTYSKKIFSLHLKFRLSFRYSSISNASLIPLSNFFRRWRT